MALVDEIEARRASIHTDGYPMSIGEIASIYGAKELDIHPEFQRFYRWTPTQKSRLIESLLLGIPIPSIFVSQRKDGVWDVIDGLQRLSTIFQFMGLLRGENNEFEPPLVLEATKYLPSLADKQWEDPRNAQNSLTSEEQLLIKRSKIDVKIVLRESDETSKYELFQRINTGGTPLSDQEVRNCLLIMINPDFYRWLAKLGKDDAFNACIAISDRAREEQYDLELIVRFLVFRQMAAEDLSKIGDLGERLTDGIMGMAKSEAYNDEQEEAAFKWTFATLARALQDNSFRRYDAGANRFLGGFLISAFEVMALGVGFQYRPGEDLLDPEVINQVAQRVWQDEEFLGAIGSGVRASSRIPETVPLGRRLFTQ
jgi:hypothetical protein